jgi:lipopolysaccharide transport system ATP-binding protein
MSGPVISVEHLSKKYLVGHQRQRAHGYLQLREEATRHVRNAARKALDMARGRQIVQGDEVEEFWALRDVSFEVNEGEVLGIIGRNGAGKSTLLKILSRITEPTEGRITIRGRVASLLEVGTGFHPELSGRENIFLNGAILGMTRAEVRRKLDEIVAFAEVEKFLDTPVKRYSSGMYVRLAFAVAAHLEPEILIVDEVLAVGDVEFQKKCLGKMSEVSHSGRTVIFVTHNLGSMVFLSTTAVLLASGKLTRAGDPRSVVAEYIAQMRSGTRNLIIQPTHSALSLVDAWTHDISGTRSDCFDSDEEILLSIAYVVNEEVDDYRIGFKLTGSDYGVIMTSTTADATPPPQGIGQHTVQCRIPRNFLAPGEYTISVAADIPMKTILFNVADLLSFSVSAAGAVGGEFADQRQGIVRPRLTWEETRRSAAAETVELTPGPKKGSHVDAAAAGE